MVMTKRQHQQQQQHRRRRLKNQNVVAAVTVTAAVVLTVLQSLSSTALHLRPRTTRALTATTTTTRVSNANELLPQRRFRRIEDRFCISGSVPRKTVLHASSSVHDDPYNNNNYNNNGSRFPLGLTANAEQHHEQQLGDNDDSPHVMMNVTQTTIATETSISTTNATITTATAPSSDSTSSEKTDLEANDNNSNNTNVGVLPTYKSLCVFIATTILIWLSEPLLSLVDTTIVGLTTASSKAVVQIAALGPATTLYDSAIYMTYFLAISLTNQLAPKLAKQDWKGSRRSTSHLMGLAALFGSIVTLITFGVGKQLISQMMGSGMDPQIIPLAANYARIRAIASPFAVVGFVAQSFCLTTLDTTTPAVAVALASIVNIIGDLALSPRWGIQGAAVATAFATVTSSLVLVNKVRRTVAEWKLKEEAETGTGQIDSRNRLDQKPAGEMVNNSEVSTSINGNDSDNDTTVSGLAGVPHSEDIPFWSLPEKKATIKLLKVAGPIFFTMMAKILCYSVMTVRASNFGVIPLASHNIMTRVFFFFACFGDSLSQAAQSFYPQVAKKSRAKLIKRLFLLSVAIGVSNYQMSGLVLQRLGRFLTRDASIIKMMSQYAPYVGYTVFLHPFIMVLEGTVLAKRDFGFMTGMYIATTLLHFGLVFSPLSATFGGLWRALFVFQFTRLVQFGFRVWDQSRKEEIPSN